MIARLIRWSIANRFLVLLATLIVGHGLRPKQLPRPVVKTITLQPPATRPVTLGGSKAKFSMLTVTVAARPARQISMPENAKRQMTSVFFQD